jgi:hypothetical protein
METAMSYENDLDAVLIAFVEAGPGASLSDWMQRHPAAARDLARLASERWTGENKLPDDAGADARVRDIGLSVFRAARRAPQAAAPLTSLLAAARARGLTADTLSARLDLPVTCFWKLHRRLFAPDSVPRGLVAALAGALDRAADEMAAYLRQPPILAAGASYRSDDTPRVGEQEDFAAALRDDPNATPAQRARWLSGE